MNDSMTTFERFVELLEEYELGDFFQYDNASNSLSTVIHAAQSTIEAYELTVESHDDSILFVTRSFLRAEKQYYKYIKRRLDKLNEHIDNGKFFIDEHKSNIISFGIVYDLDEISSQGHPFDYISSGCEEFDRHANELLHALAGTSNCHIFIFDNESN